MAKRIYSIIAAIALAMVIFLLFRPHALSSGALPWVVSALYAFLVGSIYGILGHSLSAAQKLNLIFYPLSMGVLFMVLVFIYIYLVLPIILPGFM